MRDVPIDMPRIGLGTFGRTGAAGRDAIGQALEMGYRHLDTAQTYGTESVIGEALETSGVPRSEVFLTTKIADTRLRRVDLLPSVRASLDRLRVDAVDLLLIHWPSHRDEVPFEEYIDGLAEARSAGMTRLIGVSNFTAAQVERAVARLGARAIFTNQVECHPFLQNRVLRASCARHDIIVTAYMPLAAGGVMQDPVIGRVAERHGESAATITLAWLLAQGLAAIPASARTEHLAANVRASGVRLSAGDMAEIDALDRGQRLVNPAKSPEWD